jgi:hypothetical protein
MTRARILRVEFPFGNRVHIAAALTAVVVTGEPIIVEATIVVRSVLPPPAHITRHAADISSRTVLLIGQPADLLHDCKCSHSIAVGGDRWPDEVKSSDLEP